ncbi:hypothetical protein [Flavobacterium sp. U410]|jgi:hypothetical protein
MKNLTFKKAFQVILIFAFAFSLSNCKVHNNKTVIKSAPPGQVKKATGAKSAKNYAPGQRKKK